MLDAPESAVEPAAQALCELHHLDPEWARTLARAALDAAAPVLAEAVAQKILAHMEAHGPGPTSPGVTLHETMRRAWRRHFRIAAQIASLAFSTREDHPRMAAEAIGRGDVAWCDPPEVPGA